MRPNWERLWFLLSSHKGSPYEFMRHLVNPPTTDHTTRGLFSVNNAKVQKNTTEQSTYHTHESRLQYQTHCDTWEISYVENVFIPSHQELLHTNILVTLHLIISRITCLLLITFRHYKFIYSMETTSQYLISYISHRATADYTPLDNLYICTAF